MAPIDIELASAALRGIIDGFAAHRRDLDELRAENAALKARVDALEARPYFPPIVNGGPFSGAALPPQPQPLFEFTTAPNPNLWPDPPSQWPFGQPNVLKDGFAGTSGPSH